VTPEQVDAEVRATARALLASPLVTSARDPEVVGAARRHRDRLAALFRDELGYHLDTSHPGIARLAKAPGVGHLPRGLSNRAGKPFDATRYALVCLVLAAVERGGERTTAARLFDDVASRAGEVGLRFDPQSPRDRRRFIHAVQAAEHLGVLELAEGDEEGFVRGAADGDALYRVDREVLAHLPASPLPAGAVDGPDALRRESYPDTDEGRVRRRRHRITRALVEEPVLELDDLSDDERAYALNQRERFRRVLADGFGLELEVRAEGWVAVDPDGELTDVSWPSYGTTDAAALRLCDELRSRRSRGLPEVWPRAEAVDFLRALGEEYRGFWRKGADTAEGADALYDDAVAVLASMRLAAAAPEGVRARPAAGRFAAAEAVRPAVPVRRAPVPTTEPML
jgi:uncharacterized protein (TIGR02678 family)